MPSNLDFNLFQTLLQEETVILAFYLSQFNF